MPVEKEKKQIVKSSKNPDIDTKLLEENTIDKSTKNTREKKFLNKRNIIIIVVFTLIAIGALLLTFLVVLNIDFEALFKSIGEGFVHNIGILWFALLLIGTLASIFYNWVPIAVRLTGSGYKIKVSDWIVLGLICSFIKAITPANFVADPFTMYWLTRRGLSTSKAAGIMFTNAFFWEAVQIVIKIPSFVLCMLNVNELLSDAQGIIVFIFMIVGFTLDFVGLILMTLLCVSKSVHYRLSVIFNWFRRKLHMSYHTKAEINEKYKKRAVMKQDFINYLKDWKTTIFVILAFAFFEIYTYIIVNFGMSFVQYYQVEGVGYFWIGFKYDVVYNCSAMANVANRINIIPNTEGGIEWVLRVLINSYKGDRTAWLDVPGWPASAEDLEVARKTIVDHGIFISRFFWAYLPAFFGFVTCIPIASIYIHKKRMAAKQKKLAQS